jgi:two-component system sensor histidine kinase/response regulator
MVAYTTTTVPLIIGSSIPEKFIPKSHPADRRDEDRMSPAACGWPAPQGGFDGKRRGNPFQRSRSDGAAMSTTMELRWPLPDTASARPEGPASILVVDDNPGKRLALRAMLSPLGYSIVEADSGLGALRCVVERDFAVILLDVCMPDMDGLETAALIRQRPQSEATPIIFITAYAADDIELKQIDGFSTGAIDFMYAPVPPEVLRARVSVFANLFTNGETLAARAREVQVLCDQLRFLTEAAPGGIFQTDADNRYIYTNPRWSEITGLAFEDAAGRPWDCIIDSERYADLRADFSGSVDGPEFSRRLEIQTPDGSRRVVLLTSRCIRDGEGGVGGWVGTLTAVTDEADAEPVLSDARGKQDEVFHLKSDVLANLSHNIRTPMNGVIGMTELLLETELDPVQRDYAQTVRNSGEVLLNIIDEILDISKLEAGALTIEKVSFRVRSVVDDVVGLLAGPAQARGVLLASVVESPVPSVVRGDPGQVRQVLTSLIGNAIKFTQNGTIIVRVNKEESVDQGALLRFEVADTGDGIAPDRLDLIVQSFAKTDTPTSSEGEGTGLGLSISGQLVGLMGGECGVASQLGEGSTFWFTIVHTDPELTACGSPSSIDGTRALIVNAEVTKRTELSDCLTELGVYVSTADSGQAALASLRQAAVDGRPYAVAVLGSSLPGMDGQELKNAIVADPVITARVVLITELDDGEDYGNDAPSGLSPLLTKSVPREDRLASLRVALGLKETDQAGAASSASPSSPPASAAGGNPGGGRLLVVEDNVINQKVIVAMLASGGYKVDTVVNGVEAVRAVAAESYDAVLMDCQMPEMDGYEATVAIRAMNDSVRFTPIIGVTAGAREEDRRQCLVVGMDAYLSKPVNKDVLLTLVAHSMKRVPAPGSPDTA